MMSGPHKSQSLNSCCLDCVGRNICLNLVPMALASRRNVSLMGSSNVEESSVFKWSGALISPSKSSSCSMHHWCHRFPPSGGKKKPLRP